MIFRNPAFDNSHNIAAPADTTLAGLYRYCGILGPQPLVPLANFVGTAIGPRLVCIADHIGGGVGTPYLYQGQTYTVVNRLVSTKTGAAYLFLDRDLPNWAPIWREETYSNQSQVFYVGHGMGRGTEILSGATLIGWNATPPYVTRWAVALLARLEKDPGLTLPTFACNFEDPTSECAGCVGGDSAGGCFLSTPSGWKYLGPINGSFSAEKVQFDTRTDALTGNLVLKDNADIDGWNGGGAPEPPTEEDLKILLARDFNAIIHGPSIYDEARFEGVTLRPETKALIGEDLEGDELIRFNRMLLEDAYPSELKRSLEVDVPPGEEPGDSDHWKREYLILPNCTNGIYVNNRLMVTTSWIPGGQFDAGNYGAKRDFVAASYVLDYTRFAPNNEFRINQGSSDELQALVKVGDSAVLALKDSSVGLLTGVTGDLTSLSLEMIIRNYGVVNARAAVEIGKDVVFMSPRRGLVSLKQTLENKIQGTETAFSDPIAQWINQIDWTLGHAIRLGYWNDALYVAAPIGSKECLSANLVENLPFIDFLDLGKMDWTEAGMTYRWRRGSELERFVCNNQTFTEPADVTWDGESVFGIYRSPPGGEALPPLSSVQRVHKDVNTAVLVFDFQRGAWQPIDRGMDLCVREFFVMTIDGMERLCCVTSDNYLNIYEETLAGDRVFDPVSPNLISHTPIMSHAVTRGYTAGSAGFKAGQFARLVVATLAPSYSVATRSEGVEEEANLVSNRTRDPRVYDRPPGAPRWIADNSNHDFNTPWRQDYSVYMDQVLNPLLLSHEGDLLLSTGVPLELSAKPVGFDLAEGVAVDLLQEANHPLRMTRPRGRWHQAIVANETGLLELRTVQLELTETDRQSGIKV